MHIRYRNVVDKNVKKKGEPCGTPAGTAYLSELFSLFTTKDLLDLRKETIILTKYSKKYGLVMDCNLVMESSILQ
jgi:hypothetical protein